MYRIGKVGVFTLEYVGKLTVDLIRGYQYTAIVMDLYNEDNISCTHVEILNNDIEIKPFIYYGGFPFSKDWKFIDRVKFEDAKLISK
jgi:hypothetical protein